MVDVLEALSGRRSVREYTTQTVDEASLRKLIVAATLAPSAMNRQPWAFVVVRDQELLQIMSKEAKQHMSRAMMTETSADPHAAHLQDMLKDPQFQIFHHAPVLIVICGTAAGPWITEDCAMAAQNLMLAAHAAGLGSCWIGFAQSYLNTAVGKQHLGLPPTWVPVAPIIVGHPKVMPAPVPRQEPEIRWVN